MNAQVVYQVAKALPQEEQRLLFEMLQKELAIKTSNIKKKKKPALTEQKAIEYLLKNVFNKNKSV